MTVSAPGRARPDDPLSLLQRIVDESLDPSYARAAAGRSAGASHRAPLRHRSLAFGGALAVLAMLTTVTVARTWQDEPADARSRTSLLERVAAQTAQVDAAAEEVTALGEQVGRLRAEAVGGAGADARREARLQRLAVAAGTTPVRGPGVQVLLDDGQPTGSDAPGPDVSRVLDRDLQLVVNGLFAAGAEAVDVNGQRLAWRTAIRSAGDAILVGFRPLSRPYLVTAIGDPLTLEARFADSPSGTEMATVAATYGIRFEMSTHNSLQVPGESDLQPDYVRAKGQ
jgi:uncharacterized protein YlxW (UPF0749 family)